MGQHSPLPGFGNGASGDRRGDHGLRRCGGSAGSSAPQLVPRHGDRGPGLRLGAAYAWASLLGRAIRRASALSEEEQATMLVSVAAVERAVREMITTVDGIGATGGDTPYRDPVNVDPAQLWHTPPAMTSDTPGVRRLP